MLHRPALALCLDVPLLTSIGTQAAPARPDGPWGPSVSSSIDNDASDHYQWRACKAVAGALEAGQSVRCETLVDADNQSNSTVQKILVTGASYATRIFPLLNSASLSDGIQKMLWMDSKSFIVSSANDYLNEYVLKQIPFLSQTEFGVGFESDADMTYYLNSLISLAQLGSDDNGYPLGLLFAQGSAKGAYSGSAVTNLGLGLRRRLRDNAMLGANAFWDYRFTNYSSSYSRWGAGAELWWDDFKLTNNWHIAGTGIKRITTGGRAYTDTTSLAAGTYDETTLLGANTFDERVVPGWDVALNYRLPSYPQLSLGIRGFRWDYMRKSDNSGVEGSVNWQATPHTNLSAWISSEIPAYPTQSNAQLSSGDDVYVGVRFNVQLKPVTYKTGSNRIRDNLLTQMKQPVQRRNDVLLERWKPKQKKTIDGVMGSFINQAAGI